MKLKIVFSEQINNKEATISSKYFIIIFILLYFIVFNLSSQNMNILKGKVYDEQLKILPDANILAKPISKNRKIAFTITDENGNYKLKLYNNENYQITITYLGYKPYNFELNTSKNLTRNITLEPSNDELDEIIINYKVPVIIKEDTIIYNTKIFTNGNERKLKQILKKLPGVEVDKNGSVTVMGKKVNKLLVDGKTFFGGGTKLGVENIPADAIDGVEVIDNYNEVAFLKGLTDSDKMALNVKLKKGKKKFSFGDIEASTGSEGRYLIHPNLFYYSPKTNINFIGDINDIGIKSFTIKEYLDFEGGVDKLFTNPNSYFRLSNNEFVNFLENKDFKANENKFGAINITQSINEKVEISSYAIFSNTKTQTQNETINQYAIENTQTIENRDVLSSLNNTFIMAKLSLDFVPVTNNKISYSSFFKSSKNKSKTNLETITPTVENTLSTLRNIDVLTVKQSAEWHKKISLKNTTSLTANYHYDENNPITKWLTSEPILQNLIPLVDDSEFNINQIKKLKLHNLNLLFKHYWILNNNNHIYTTVGNNFLSENYFTNDFQELTNGTINNFSSINFGNDLDFQLNDLYIGIQHKFKTGKLTLKSGVSLHNYNWKINQSNIINKDKLILLPDFLAKFDFSKSEHLNIKYNFRSSFADAPKYANQFQLLRYNAVRRGNENLENELYHSARLLYTKFSLYRGIVMSGSVGFNKKIKSIRNQAQLVNINQFSAPFLTRNPETTWTFSGNIRKKISTKLTGKLRGNLRYSDYLQIINNKTSKNKSSTSSFGVELATNLKKLPNIELGYTKSFSKFLSSNNTSRFSNESPYINIEYDFSNGFILSADYSRNNYKDNNRNINSYEIANASLFYQKEDSPWGFKISGTNILGVDFKNENSFSDFIISDNKTFVLPRILLFTVTYKI